MQRYRPSLKENYSLGGSEAAMRADDDGEFVRLSDVTAALSDQEGKLRRRVLDEIRALAPHELPCECPARGIAALDQHAAECPRGAMHTMLASLASTPDQDGDCERVDRCPTCLSRNPMFTHCKDPAKAETGRDAPPLRDRGPSCTDPWHGDALKNPRADQDGSCEECGGSGKVPRFTGMGRPITCHVCRGTGKKPRADHD